MEGGREVEVMVAMRITFPVLRVGGGRRQAGYLQSPHDVRFVSPGRA